MFNTGQPIVTLTDTAAMHVKRLIEQGDSDVVGLRVGVKTAGCSGMKYNVEYATQPYGTKFPVDPVITGNEEQEDG